MKAKRILIVLLFVTAAGMSGCGQTIRQQYAQQLVVSNAAKEQLIMFRQAGVIDDELYKEIDPWWQATDKFLGQLKHAVATNQPDLFKTYLHALKQALWHLQSFNAKAQGEFKWPLIIPPSVVR